MSIHLVACAARVQLPPAQKLLLLCLAEDSRNDERHASPGRDVAVMWTGLSPSSVSAAMRALKDLELVAEVRAGRRNIGTTVYQVFPHGCCAAHGQLPASGASDAERVGPESARRPLTPKQRAARLVNVEKIAARRRAASASDAGSTETPVDSPTDRNLSGSQHPKPSDSASEAPESGSDASDPSRNYNLPTPPPTSPCSDVTPPVRERAAEETPVIVEPSDRDPSTPESFADRVHAQAPEWPAEEVAKVERGLAEQFGGSAGDHELARALITALSLRPLDGLHPEDRRPADLGRYVNGLPYDDVHRRAVEARNAARGGKSAPPKPASTAEAQEHARREQAREAAARDRERFTADEEVVNALPDPQRAELLQQATDSLRATGDCGQHLQPLRRLLIRRAADLLRAERAGAAA